MDSFILLGIIMMSVIVMLPSATLTDAQEKPGVEIEIPKGIPHPERGFEPCTIEVVTTPSGETYERCEPNKRMDYTIIFDPKDNAKSDSMFEELNREDIDRGTRFKDIPNSRDPFESGHIGLSGSFEFSNSDGVGKINAIKAKMNSLGIRDAVYAEIRVTNTWHHFETLMPCELVETVVFGDPAILNSIT